MNLFPVCYGLMFIKICRLLFFNALNSMNDDGKGDWKMQCNRFSRHFYCLAMMSFQIQVLWMSQDHLYLVLTPCGSLLASVQQCRKAIAALHEPSVCEKSFCSTFFVMLDGFSSWCHKLIITLAYHASTHSTCLVQVWWAVGWVSVYFGSNCTLYGTMLWILIIELC